MAINTNDDVFSGGMEGPAFYKIGSDFVDNADIGDTHGLFNSVNANGTAPAQVDGVAGGAMRLLTGSTDTNFANVVGVGEPILLEANKKYRFLARFRGEDATDSHWHIGIADKGSTDPVNAAPTDGIFFRKDDGDTNLDISIEKAGTADDTTAVATVADATWYTVGFEIHMGDSTTKGLVKFYVDGDVVHEEYYASSLPSAAMALFANVETGAAATKYLDIDYITFIGER